MRTTLRATLAATAVVGLLAVPTVATAVDTTVSFTVASSGSLAVSQTTNTATLDNGGSDLDFNALLPGTVSGGLPALTITDDRGTLAAAWTVSVGIQADGDGDREFDNTTDTSVSVDGSNAHVYIDVADLPTLVTDLAASGFVPTGVELVAGLNRLGGAPYTLIAGTTTLGNGSTTITPVMAVTVPAATPAGTYTATVQQTIS